MRQIPNIITLGNLFCGILGIVFILKYDNIEIASYLLLLGLIFDFSDGLVARLLKVSSELGKQLDSLSDLVSFGVLPSCVFFSMMNQMACVDGKCTGLIPSNLFPYGAFIIALFSAYRLAKFNIDTRQTKEFIGLPTPANAAFIFSIYFLSKDLGFLNSPKVLMLIAIVFSYLLISEIRLMSLKIDKANRTSTIFQVILIGLALPGIIIFQWKAVPVILILFIFLSLVKDYFFSKKDIQ